MPNIEINSIIKPNIERIKIFRNEKIQTIDAEDVNYNDFFENFMLKNLPCIIKNVTASWDCTKNWIDKGTVNFDYFITNYGDLEAPVADCGAINYNSHCKINMKIKDYMLYMKNPRKDKVLYLKDWHLQRLQPEDRFYKIPHFFASDWLNEFAIDLNEDDFMFVYIGTENSWTPLHADVYNSYSWSVNVVGRKKWTLFPPGEEEGLKDTLRNLPLLFSAEKFPDTKYYEIIQERGDAIFVPSGWYHQVINLLDTISINHNWVNCCNIELVWLSLEKCLLSVEQEIEDLNNSPEFISQCQVILKSLFGMNFTDFAKFLCYIAKKRLSQLNREIKTGFYDFEFGYNHILFDLKIIHKLINSINAHHLFSNKLLAEVNEFDLDEIKQTIEKKIQFTN